MLLVRLSMIWLEITYVHVMFTKVEQNPSESREIREPTTRMKTQRPSQIHDWTATKTKTAASRYGTLESVILLATSLIASIHPSKPPLPTASLLQHSAHDT